MRISVESKKISNEISLVFSNDNNDGKCEVVFNGEEIHSMIEELVKVLDSIKTLESNYAKPN